MLSSYWDFWYLIADFVKWATLETLLRSRRNMSLFLSRNIAACTFAEALHFIFLSCGSNWDFKEDLNYDFYSQLEQKEDFWLDLKLASVLNCWNIFSDSNSSVKVKRHVGKKLKMSWRSSFKQVYIWPSPPFDLCGDGADLLGLVGGRW